jgi:hypothetical protein
LFFRTDHPCIRTLDRGAVEERGYSACRKLQHFSPRLCNFYFVVGNSLAPMHCRPNGAIWDNDNKDNMNTKASPQQRDYIVISMLFFCKFSIRTLTWSLLIRKFWMVGSSWRLDKTPRVNG